LENLYYDICYYYHPDKILKNKLIILIF